MANVVDMGTRVERPSFETHGGSRFNEVDLRRMLEHGSARRPDIIEGRFVIEARHTGQMWEVVVEPDEIRQLVVVITAYPLDQAKS